MELSPYSQPHPSIQCRVRQDKSDPGHVVDSMRYKTEVAHGAHITLLDHHPVVVTGQEVDVASVEDRPQQTLPVKWGMKLPILVFI